MSEQGFNALNYKPYKGIGDPFYLDEKKLILHSLGQWDENQEWETSSSSEDDEENTSSAAAPKASMTAAKFVLRRTRKDLNTLNKEVVKGRSMIRNVRLGHGLFDLIRQERLAKKVAAAAEKKKNLEQQRNQWQAARDSSSDESDTGHDVTGNQYDLDDDLAKDEDLENFFGPNIQDGHTEMGVVNDGLSIADDAIRSPRSKISSAKSRLTSAGKKKGCAPRPFTPLHNCLTEFTEYNEEISREALFRQLCALNWILDAMNLEHGCSMAPVSTCWSHLEIGGTKISAKRAGEERRAERDWDAWLNNQQRVQKKVRVNRLSRNSRLLSHPRVSLQSTSISPSSSSSQVNTVAASQQYLAAPSGSREVPEHRTATPDEEETLHKSGIFKFLDEYYDSLRRQEEAQKGVEPISATPIATTEANQTTPSPEEAGGKKKKKHREGRSSKKSKAQDAMRLDSPEDKNRSRFILKDLRNDLNYKPRNTAELQEFHANKASVKYATLRQDLHNKFKEVQDDKAMTLHDVLEQMERERMTKCQNKFRGLQTDSMSFYRAVEEMRKEGERMIPRPEDMRRQSSFKGNWYTELLQSIPDEMKQIWFYRTVLQKLSRYGLVHEDADGEVENTSKQSVYKFLKVLEGLRRWEICAPDVAAAVEFCRARIVDMSVEEFEEWFSQAFPKVLRPNTAPARGGRAAAASTTNGGGAAAGGNNDGVNGGSGAVSNGTIGNSRVTITINNLSAGQVSGGGGPGSGRALSGIGGQGQGYGAGSVRLAQGEGRIGVRSAVSVANGADGRQRMVQSAMVRRR